MDALLRDLSVIGQVPRHGRISSGRDGLYLERPGPLLFCKRFLYGDSRSQLIRDLKELSERVALMHDMAPTEIGVRIAECVEGLGRLHDTTYSKDAVMRSMLKIQGDNLTRSSEQPVVRGSRVSQDIGSAGGQEGASGASNDIG